MTGTIITRKTSAGIKYLYVQLSYKDPATETWKTKTISTGLTAQGNLTSAKERIPEYIKTYNYLEQNSEEKALAEVLTDTPFFKYMYYWLERRRKDVKLGDLRSSTYEKYEYEVRRMAPYFEKKGYKIGEITKKQIWEYLDYAHMYGKTNQKTHKREPLAARTVAEYKAILKQIFDYAIRYDELLKTNPCDGIVLKKKTPHKKDEYLFLTEEEAADLIEFVELNYPDFLGIVFFGMYYGLRREEILGLKWDAIDIKKKSMEICYTVTRIKDIHAEADTKTENSFRTLPLSSKAIEILEQTFNSQSANKLFYGNEYRNKENYVFTWPDGRPYNPDYLTRHFKRMITRFGRPELTFHKLRHTCASMLISQNWNPKQVQYWMGHSDIQTTLNIYSHIDKAKLFDKMDDLEAITAAIDSRLAEKETSESGNILTFKKSRNSYLKNVMEQ